VECSYSEVLNYIKSKSLERGKTPTGLEVSKALFGSSSKAFWTRRAKKLGEEWTYKILKEKALEQENLSPWLKHAKDRKTLESAKGRWKKYARINYQPEPSVISKPLIIQFSSDWHLGALGCDYEQLQLFWKFVCNLPSNVVTVLLGDLIDNTVSFRVKAAELTSLPPEEQQVLLADMLEKLRPERLWAACWGNHDQGRDEKILGYSPVTTILRKHCKHYFYGKGWLDIVFGTQTYRIFLAHHARGYSMYHPFQDLYRAYREGEHFDIGVSGHFHNPAYTVDYPYIEPETNKPVKRVCIKTGTYLIDAVYQNRAYKNGIPSNPCVVLESSEKVFSVFDNVLDALRFTGDSPEKYF